MSVAPQLADFLAARGFALDRDGLLIVSGREQVTRFYEAIGEALDALPSRHFDGLQIHESTPVLTASFGPSLNVN